jgi:hypothetical protein
MGMEGLYISVPGAFTGERLFVGGGTAMKIR